MTKEDGFFGPLVTRCLDRLQKERKDYQWMYLFDYEASKSAMSKNS